MSDTLRVFISYARSDCTAFADELLTGLEVAGFEPFLDRHDIAAGEDWEARLGGLIQSADTIVFVISPGAVKSERCAWEVEKATELSKRIIPVVAVDVPEAETPEALKRLNYIFFSDGHSYSKGLGGLKSALQTDLQWIREHTRLGELAARWRAREEAEALLLRGSELETSLVWLAAWKVPAPEPTDAHRKFIGQSESAEAQRHHTEMQRREEIAVARASAAAAKRMRRATIGWAALVIVLLIGNIAGAAGLVTAHGDLADARGYLATFERQLDEARAELLQLAAELERATQADNPQEGPSSVVPGRSPLPVEP